MRSTTRSRSAKARCRTSSGGSSQGKSGTNGFNPNPGGCASPDTDCSDAEDRFIPPGGDPLVGAFQQFALFANTSLTRMLVGAEDNRLELLPEPDSRDSDSNDFIWSIDVETGGSGCSPGYWTYGTGWPALYTPGRLFGSVFSNAFPGKTLQQVIPQGGGGLNALGGQTVAALLNAASLGSSYEVSTHDVIAQFNAACASGGTSPRRTGSKR